MSLTPFDNAHERLLQLLRTPFDQCKQARERGPVFELEMHEASDGSVEVRASLPGISKKDIEVNVTGSRLTIFAERREEKMEARGTYHISEMRYGSMSRSIQLPQSLSTADASAAFADGVLSLRFKRDPALGAKKTIEIK